MAEPRRILCIRLSAVGDVINTLPALEAIRRGFPKAHIGFVVEDRAHDLIARHPLVDRVHLYRRKRWARWLHQPTNWPALYREFGAFTREIRGERYEIALNFQANLKFGIRGKVGFFGADKVVQDTTLVRRDTYMPDLGMCRQDGATPI